MEAFEYTTPKIRLDHDSLDDELLNARSFHLICSPKRVRHECLLRDCNTDLDLCYTQCIELTTKIMKKRGNTARPIFIWEPVPDGCTQAELAACHSALKHVDVVSPNHIELCDFFGRRGQKDNGSVDFEVVTRCCSDWLENGIGQDGKGYVVVRAGKEGCYAAMRESKWLMPAYHEDSERVIDPTGGGNAFLGGFAVGMVRAKDEEGWDVIEQAMACGSIAASFAIEQIGMPKLSDTVQEERWNEEVVEERLERFKQRCKGR